MANQTSTLFTHIRENKIMSQDALIDTKTSADMSFKAAKLVFAGGNRRVRNSPKLMAAAVISFAFLLTVNLTHHHDYYVSCLQQQQRRRRRGPAVARPRHRTSPPSLSLNDGLVYRSQRHGEALRMAVSPTSPNPASSSATTTTPSLSTPTSLGSSVVASSTEQQPPFTTKLQQFRVPLLSRLRQQRRLQFQQREEALSPAGSDSEATAAATTSSSDVPTDRQWTKRNLGIALPALMGLLADPVLSMVDTAFVGRVSSIDLAALGVCTSLFHMAFTIFRASTVATTSLVGSAESIEEKRQITRISLGFAGVMGSLVMLALRFGGPVMLESMGISKTASPAMYKSACDYLFARCWAAPAVVGIVVAEGAFRGNHDNSTPLIAASIAALINLVLDPVLMFPLGMGMAGAALATALSQIAAAGLYGWRLWKRQLLPQAHDKVKINVSQVLKRILGANAACLAKNGSMLVFYTSATAFATRMGAAHVATHQVCLSLFWLVTMWLDSGSVSAQLLMAENMERPERARSLTKYMTKFALTQGLAFSALVAAVGKYVPGVFTSDPTVIAYIAQCLPYLALQQTLVSVCLVLEGLVAGGNQFKFLASGTAAATLVGVWQMSKATTVIDIWASAVNVFFGFRLINAVIGVIRVHMDIRRKQSQKIKDQPQIALSSIPLKNDLADDSTTMIPLPISS
jgi:putative MATE family efflux protein